MAGDHWWVEDDTSFDCHCGNLETIAHFLFHCPIYSSLREEWDLPQSLPDSAKLEWLGHRPLELKQFIDSSGRFDHKNPIFQETKARFDHCFVTKPHEPLPLPSELL